MDNIKITIFSIAAGLLLVAAGLNGCNGCRNSMKHFQSATIGMDRTVTLYNANGDVIKSWKTDSKIEDKGGTVYFISAGKAVTISGTFTIEEN